MYETITKNLIKEAINFDACQDGIEQAESLIGEPVWKLRLDYITWAVDKRLVDKSMIIQAVKNGADIHVFDDHPLRWAAASGYFKIVKFLVEHGADIHIFGDYPLRWSARNGHFKIVKFLVEHGANIHADGDYVLYWSHINGHTEIRKYLGSKISA